MDGDRQLFSETANFLLECVRPFLTQRNLSLINIEEWNWTDEDYATPRVSYGWSHPVVPHENPASIASAIAIRLRQSLLEAPVGKWSKIVLSLELSQPVSPETRKWFMITVRLA
jgi:hypothetical protein